MFLRRLIGGWSNRLGGDIYRHPVSLENCSHNKLALRLDQDTKLRMVIERDETDYYVAQVPVLPGCFSQGKTLAEAKAHIREALPLPMVRDKSWLVT